MGPAVLVIVFSALLVAISAMLLLATRRRDPDDIRFVAVNEWALQHFCRATPQMLGAAPQPPRSVALDLGEVPTLEPTTLAALEDACAQWSAAGTRVTIQRCCLPIAAVLWRRGVRAEVTCAARPETTTLH